VQIKCVRQMTGYALKKKLCWLQKPGDSGYMSGDSGYMSRDSEHQVRSIRLRNRSIQTSCIEHRVAHITSSQYNTSPKEYINGHFHSPFVIKCQKGNEKSKEVYSSSSSWAPSSEVSSSSSESEISR
jgi:hypothetical protein